MLTFRHHLSLLVGRTYVCSVFVIEKNQTQTPKIYIKKRSHLKCDFILYRNIKNIPDIYYVYASYYKQARRVLYFFVQFYITFFKA